MSPHCEREGGPVSWRVLGDVAHTLGPASASHTHSRGCVAGQQAGSQQAAARLLPPLLQLQMTQLSACTPLHGPV